MMRLTRVLVTTASLCVMAAIASAVVCLADGGSTTVTGTRPKDPPLGENGKTSRWDRDSPRCEEQDMTTNDDMGKATVSPSDPATASATVTNHGGSLSGPNGVGQNGGAFEGSCIEVVITWTWYLWFPDPEELGGGSWATFHLETGYTEICPCGSSECPVGTPPC